MPSKILSSAVMACTVLAAAPALADQVLSDKTSATYDSFGMSNIFTKVSACGCGPADSAAVVDSFTLSSTSRLTSVDAAINAIQQNAVSNFTGFANAQGYQVNIYSSLSAAAANITGDVYSTTLAPADVTFGAGPSLIGFSDFGVVASAMAHLAVDIRLHTGTYYLSVVGIDDPDSNESIGVFLSGGAASGHAVAVNPGGAFGFDDNILPLGEDAGYRVNGIGGVPEPSSWALMIVGFGLAGASLRRRTAAA